MNCFNHSILAMVSSIPIISFSVDFFSFVFYFFENLYTATHPRDIIFPIFPQQSFCTAYEVSTHHFTAVMSPMLEVRISFLVPLRYFNMRFSFTQSLLFGFFTCMVINSTALYMSGCDLVLMNRSCATVWWKICACSSGRYFLFSHHVPWRGGKRPGWSWSCLNAMVTLVTNFLVILSCITSLPFALCSQGPFSNSFAHFHCTLWVLHKYLTDILKT